MNNAKISEAEKMSDEKIGDEKSDDFCQDCEPAFAAFLEQMAEHNKEQMTELSAKAACPSCGKVHEYTFPYAPKASAPPAA